MTFDDYQKAALETAVYPDRGKTLCYPTIGLAGEAGEVSEKVKKLMRDHGGRLTNEYRDAISLELGDCLWYISELAIQIGVSLDLVASRNIEKLRSRKHRSKINGNGDYR